MIFVIPPPQYVNVVVITELCLRRALAKELTDMAMNKR
jgi:hypothetical protein